MRWFIAAEHGGGRRVEACPTPGEIAQRRSESDVIGGDAGNDTVAPPRATSTFTQVEALAKGADVIVHSAIHPVMAPDRGTGFARSKR
jgi:hypothetical protein